MGSQSLDGRTGSKVRAGSNSSFVDLLSQIIDSFVVRGIGMAGWVCKILIRKILEVKSCEIRG